MVESILGDTHMKIKEVHISNFKSFKKSSFYLKDFNMILGANGSGKSNFFQIIKFLRDIVDHGLENAIALQGGKEYLMNTTIGDSKSTKIVLNLVPYGGEIIKENKNQSIVCDIQTLTYSIDLSFKGEEVTVKESLNQSFNIEIAKRKKTKMETIEKIGEGSTKVTLINGVDYHQDLDLPEDLLEEYEINDDRFKLTEYFYSLKKGTKRSKDFNAMLLKNPTVFFGATHNLRDTIANSSVYYIDTNAAKKAVQVIGKTSLEEDGSNLPLILHNITKDKKRSERLTDKIGQLIPFISGVNVEKQPDNSVFFQAEETYQNETTSRFPASLLSDGTINITALIVALFFEEDKDILFFEEPERNIHPQLLSGILNLMKEVSQKKQIILTSHNPYIVKDVDPDNVIFIKRGADGFSKTIAPSKNEIFKTFISNDLNLEDIFVNDMIFEEN
ncbi:AAA family ATPase [Bacillus altitudinis]|uniref:AAA family ATPase n=1 Tax=Bacillus altitudinis TaxID=293387 RepID=UPI003D220682